MKDVKELNRDQLVELKQAMLCERMDQHGECPSYGELAEVDETISDEEVYIFYAGFIFSPDDFFCTAGQED